MPTSVFSNIRGRYLLPVAIASALVVAASWFGGCGVGDVQQAGNAAGSSNSGSGGDNSGSGGGYGSGGDNSGSGGDGSGGDNSGSGGDNGSGGDLGSGGSAPPPPASSRVDVIIDQGWKFNRGDVPGAEAPAFDDGAWASLDLPYTWNADSQWHDTMQPAFGDGENGPTTTPGYWRGVSWFRKHYTIPADTMKDKKIYLQFDGSAYITDCWVNGTKVGTHSGGYSAFRFDITAAAKVGQDNVIAVKVDNTQSVAGAKPYAFVKPPASTANVPPRTGDFTMFGGIYRDLHVLATDPLAISPMDYGSSGVYLKPTNVSAASADLSVTVKLLNGNAAAKTATVTVDILDADGKTVQTLTGMQSVAAGMGADLVINDKVANPHLWNGLADPYVYHANVTVKDGDRVTDAVQQPLGFRSFSFDANTGFSLNGKSYPLHGVCMHQDHIHQGGKFLPKEIDNDFAMIKEMGANCVRFAHYAHPQYTYDKADHTGIIGWAENALVDSIYDTPEFAANAKQQLIEVIRQNYNHPSLFIWAISNEILLRPSTTAAGDILVGTAPIQKLVTDLNNVAHTEDPTRKTVNSCANNLQEDPVNYITDLSAFNRYNGWYYQTINDFATWADQKHAAYPNKLIAVAEYGVGVSVIQHALPIVEQTSDRTGNPQTEEYGAIFHERYWKMIQTRPFLVWTTVWNMFDFATDYRNEGLVPGLNTKGLVSYDRKTRKDAFYWYKANWGTEPMVHINYRRFAAMPKSANEIRVYSNQPEVDLKLNGTSLGKKSAPDHLFIWTGVTWKAGANDVEATPTNGMGGTDKVTWMN
jgi:beta-galactosidase